MSKFPQTWSVLHVAFRESLRPQNILLSLVGLLAMVCMWHAAGSALLPLEEPTEVATTVDGKEPVTKVSHATTKPAVNVRLAEAVAHHKTLASPSSRALDGGVLAESALADGAPPADRAQPANGVTWLSGIDIRSRPIHCIEVYARFSEPGRRLFLVGHTWKSFLYYVVGGVLSVLIWAFVGLPIARSTVVRVAASSISASKASLQFGRTKGFDVFGAIALPMVGIAMMAIPIVALGFLMRLDIGVLIAGLLWILVAIVSCFMAILAAGLFAGWPLMWGAVAADDADSFDAISRSYAYALQRPLNYLGYLLISVALGTVGYLAAWGVSEMVIQLCYWCAQLGTGADRMSEILAVVNSTGNEPSQSSMITIAAQIIRTVNGLVRYLASAYSFSFFFSAMAAIYMLLRRDTDETEIDQIAGPDPGTDSGQDSGTDSSTV